MEGSGQLYIYMCHLEFELMHEAILLIMPS